MREFCDYYEEFISDMPEDVVSECGFMPESCNCIECPYYMLVEVEADDA